MDRSLISALLTLAASPIGISAALGVLAIFFRSKRQIVSNTLTLISIITLWACSTPMIANYLAQQLESQYPAMPLEEISPARAIILLGGGLQIPEAPRLHAELNNSGDRLLHAFRLFKAGKAPLIIVSGGNVFANSPLKSEAHYTSELLIELGVPEQQILLESVSRNTMENAVETKKLIDNIVNPMFGNQSKEDDFLLVTSAFHMPRAMFSFESVGLSIRPSETDFRVTRSSSPHILSWIPSAHSLALTSTIFREWLGIFAYSLPAK